MNITITIPDSKVNELRTGFLKIHPVPINEETGEPLYTEIAWVKSWLFSKLLEAYKEGKRKIAVETTPPTFENMGDG